MLRYLNLIGGQDGSDQSDKDVVVDDDMSPDDTARAKSPLTRLSAAEERR